MTHAKNTGKKNLAKLVSRLYFCAMKYADKEIQEMEEFFRTVKLPDRIELTPGSVIIDVPSFVSSHLAIMKQKKGVGLFEPFYDRLVLAKEKLSAQ